MSEKVFDVDDVMERVQDDVELLEELLEIFEEDHQAKRKSLEEVVAQENYDEIKDITHSMKGAAGNIAAKTIYAICLKIEILAEEQKIEEIKTHLPALVEQFAAFQQEVQKARLRWT